MIEQKADSLGYLLFMSALLVAVLLHGQPSQEPYVAA
jgi:hypothetical protein